MNDVLSELARGVLRRANHASIVVEIVDGPLRLVLGGDLPRTTTPKKPTVVPTGWDAVMRTHPDLATHGFLKIAHHGSHAASHDGLMAPPPSHQRVWAVTPFNRSGIPRPSVVSHVLSAQTPLCVSHPPARWHIGSRDGFRVRSIDVVDRNDAEPTGIAFADGAIDGRPSPPRDPFDPVCVFAFHPTDGLQGSWFGPSAVEVHP